MLLMPWSWPTADLSSSRFTVGRQFFLPHDENSGERLTTLMTESVPDRPSAHGGEINVDHAAKSVLPRCESYHR